MTREEIYSKCVEEIAKTNCLLMELATGTGKTKLSIDLTNYIIKSKWYQQAKTINILILVAKIVHKQTWAEEIEKWGGINHPTASIKITMECYESLQKHCNEKWDIVIGDECHHVASEKRMAELKTLKYGYMIGLSATIPRNVKAYFKFNFHSQVVSCDIIEAIEAEVLPEPTILLFPLQMENTKLSETVEINPKAKGPIFYGEYKDRWKCKNEGRHAILKCTQQQKLIEINKLVDWSKRKVMAGNLNMKQTWLRLCGERLEFLADCKLQWVKLILHHLDKERTITFCKTISQTEQLGKNCIHSQNKDATKIYERFNAGKIDHITAVNILNENANLVNCRYAVFCNLSSSDVVVPQRIGRSLRHKDPVIIFPYYKGTREEELVLKAIEGFNKVKTINSVKEI